MLHDKTIQVVATEGFSGYITSRHVLDVWKKLNLSLSAFGTKYINWETIVINCKHSKKV